MRKLTDMTFGIYWIIRWMVFNVWEDLKSANNKQI